MFLRKAQYLIIIGEGPIIGIYKNHALFYVLTDCMIQILA